MLVVIIISASGVMSPGPLFAANISCGIRGGTKSGIKVAIGHTIVELPLIVLLGVGVVSLELFPEFRTIISILGAIALFVFAAIQIRSIIKRNQNSTHISKQSPLLTGVLLTGLNPFFLVWWISIGLKLISDAVALWSFIGIIIVFVAHIWMDFVWLGTVSFFASKSSRFISDKNYKILMIVLSGVLVYFGVIFLLEAIPEL